MIPIRELQRWLKTLPTDGAVGIDEGGLMLMAFDADDQPVPSAYDTYMNQAYLEVGGIPDPEEES